MRKIKNYKKLAITPLRRLALDLLDVGLAAIDTQRVIEASIQLTKNALQVKGHSFSLNKFKRIFVVGVGKCAIEAGIGLERVLGQRLEGGLVIDVRRTRSLKKIRSFLGHHPNPSDENIDVTKKLVSFLKQLTDTDLVLCVVSGGGSTILCSPEEAGCQEESLILGALSRAGADIKKINTVRKHLSYARGGYLAKYAYPATVISLIFSDVVGDVLDFVASGPTFKDTTTIKDAEAALAEYGVPEKCGLEGCGLIETPKEDKYFERVHNVLMVDNQMAVDAMAKRAKEQGFAAEI